MFRYILITLALAFLSPLAAHAASDEGTLGAAVRAIAEDIVKVLPEGATLTVGAFPGVGPVANQASTSPTVIQQLAQQLLAHKVIVQQRGTYTLVGEFGEVEDTNTHRQAIEIKWKIVETKNRDKILFTSVSPEIAKEGDPRHRYVTHQRAVAVLLGINTETPIAGNEKEQQEAMKESIDHPKVALDGTKIKFKKDSPFAMSILTAPENHPKAGKREFADYKVQTPTEEKDNKGFAFVPIQRDEVYAVQLFNDADFDAAVELRIDGLSMYTFSAKEFRDDKDQPRYRYVIVPAKKSVLIRGWHVSNAVSDEFLVTSYAKSAAGQVRSTANVGTITASFHASWDRKTGKPPADEPKKPIQSASPADATGRGTRFDQKFVEVDNDVGAFRGAISVRYTK